MGEWASGWHVRAFWGPRPSDGSSIAVLIGRLLEVVEQLRPDIRVWGGNLDEWFVDGRLAPDDAAELWAQAVSVYGTGDPVTFESELVGFGSSLSDPLVQFSVSIGSGDELNLNGVDWQLDTDTMAILEDARAVEKFVIALAKATDADWVSVYPDSPVSWQSAKPEEPVLGWVTYLAGAADSLPADPAGVFRVEHVHRGRLILADRDAERAHG